MIAKRTVSAICIPLLLLVLSPQKTYSQINHLQFLVGKWQVTGVRLDETLMRTPAYNIDDPELVGRTIVVSREEILTSMPVATKCHYPTIKPEASTIDALVNRTMGKAKYSEESTNKFALPVDTTKEVEVLWVTCKDGHIGPDTPFGPRRSNWIATLSANKLAMRWYDNTILLLTRQQR